MSRICKVWFWVVWDEENIMVKKQWGRICAHYFLCIKSPPPPWRFSSPAANVQKFIACLRTYSISYFNSNHTECYQCYRVLSPSHFMFVILYFVSHYYYYYQLFSFRFLVFNLFCTNCPLIIIKWININNAYYVFFLILQTDSDLVFENDQTYILNGLSPDNHHQQPPSGLFDFVHGPLKRLKRSLWSLIQDEDPTKSDTTHTTISTPSSSSVSTAALRWNKKSIC